MAPSQCNLSTSRVVRLFRPLRAKCRQLISVLESPSSRHRHSAPITYTSRQKCSIAAKSRPSPSEFTLTIIPPPNRLRSLDESSKDNYKLSKALYDVWDAYQNILQACFGKPGSRSSLGEESSRVPSLSILCATVVGHAIEYETMATRDRGERPAADDEEDVDIVTEIYEDIPPHHRMHAVAAHALSVILDSSPRHPTLLSILFGTSLQFGLLSESRILLREILVVASQSTVPALSSSTSLPQPPQLISALHSEFLVSLLYDCSTTLAPHTAQPTMNHREFTRVLIDVFNEDKSGSATDVWTCKAVRRLARKLRSEDFTAFTLLCTGISGAIDGLGSEKGPKSRASDDRRRLEDRLSRWIEFALDVLSSPRPQEDFDAVIDLIDSMSTLALRAAAGSSLSNITQSLAIFCLASPFYPDYDPGQKRVLCHILNNVKPTTEAFEKLMSLILGDRLDVSHATMVPTLEKWAMGLRSSSLLLHEASFWTAALRFVEDHCIQMGVSSTQASNPCGPQSRSFDNLRAQLVDRVDEAERRCFGAEPSHSDSASSNNILGDGEWRWEEMIGTWVRKSPLVTKVAKKPKLQRELQALQGKRRKQQSYVDNTDTWSRKKKRLNPMGPLTDSTTSPLTSNLPSRSSRISMSPSLIVVDEDDVTPPSSPSRQSDLENIPPGPRSAIPTRRTLNFDSILADAQLNHIVLHAHNTPRQLKPFGNSRQKKNYTTESPIRGTYRGPDLSSDDAINLFALSSPLIIKGR